MSRQLTPKKEENLLNTSQFIPIKLHESPGSKTAQRNLTGYPRIIRDLSADIFNDIQQWNGLHIRGAKIIKEIASLKATTYKQSHYPPELEPLCNNVLEVVNALEIIVESLKAISKKMSPIVNLHKSNTPLFISWPTSKFVLTAEKIANVYAEELDLKRTICENIAHSKDEEEATFHAVTWAVQPFIENDVNIALESLLTETGHRSIGK
ncbi:cyclin-dependent kinase 2-interacting protein-like [Chrysoperla carnea]|uniref:cyclin-dependent kinase 2-interacting protein-like n=1 Tax=Chrysoperla carnea TaxID=189513 RepID=UPI001D088877|nr:cyclin-dependent kinase 2-interacting protein-like [Chrysoperla carnea]